MIVKDLRSLVSLQSVSGSTARSLVLVVGELSLEMKIKGVFVLDRLVLLPEVRVVGSPLHEASHFEKDSRVCRVFLNVEIVCNLLEQGILVFSQVEIFQRSLIDQGV